MKLQFNDSLIVREEEVKMICNWINPNKNIKAKLLYRVSRDGDGPNIFHKYCDNKGPTIIFAKIKNYIDSEDILEFHGLVKENVFMIKIPFYFP